MRLSTLLLPLQRIAKLMGMAQCSQPAAGAHPTPAVSRIGWAVQSAAARTPWESACLVQALAGMAMLRLRKIPSVLYLGVARNTSDSEVAAHAWLCSGGVTLTGGGRGQQRFTVLSTFVWPHG